MPKDTPILFTGEMVRAILSRRKTQTRRIVKQTNRKDGAKLMPELLQSIGVGSACPYGMPGDRLWVRETWAWPGEEQVLYKANPDDAALVERWKTDPNCPQVKWTPSIHMPKKFCRLWLELAEVRVERLQECSEADALAEGITGPHHVGYPAYRMPGDSKPRYSSPIAAYESLWESINGADSWAENPWVWVLTFKRVING